jgi:transposase-like protein
MGKHRFYDPVFKAHIVLEVLQGRKTKARACSENNIAPSLLTYWTERLIERSPRLFVTKSQRENIKKQAHITELERIVSELNSELTALKNCESIYPLSDNEKP